MTATPQSDLLDLIARLQTQLDEAVAGLRITSEWKEAEAFVRRLQESGLDRFSEDDGARGDVYRELEAQEDLLALARERTEQQEAVDERVRVERLRTDKAILRGIEDEFGTYRGMMVGTLGAVLAIGFLLPWLVAVAALPVLFGWSRMRSRMRPTIGRTWLLLHDEVSRVTDAARTHDIGAVCTLLVPVIWLLVFLFTRGGGA